MTEENKSMRQVLLETLEREHIYHTTGTGYMFISDAPTAKGMVVQGLVVKAMNGDLDAIEFLFKAEF